MDEQLLCIRHIQEFFAKCLQGFTARMPRMPYRDSRQAVNRSRRQKYSRAEYIIVVHPSKFIANIKNHRVKIAAGGLSLNIKARTAPAQGGGLGKTTVGAAVKVAPV